MCTYHSLGAVLRLSDMMAPQAPARTFRPTFILMRSVTKSGESIGNGDSRNLLFGLQLAGLPAVNSLASVFSTLERVSVHAELKRVQRQLGGKEAFPLIEQDYYPSHKEMSVDPGFPCVIKIGGCHSGLGKILVHDRVQWTDVKSIVALHSDYATAEPFIKYDYELRLQKIGALKRALKRYSSTWKGNTSAVSVEEVPMTEEFARWLDAAASIFGGLDICALDVVHSVKDDRFIILELNDTAIGLANQHEAEDHGHIRDLTLVRMAAAAAAHAAAGGAPPVPSPAVPVAGEQAPAESSPSTTSPSAAAAAGAAGEQDAAKADSLAMRMELQGAVAAREKAEARLQQVELKVMQDAARRDPASKKCTIS